MRWFAEELPQLRVIAAGSLLDFALLRPESSMPVGRLTFGHLEPMTFAEFLLASDEARLLAAIQEVTPSSPLAEPLHDRAVQLVRDYMIVGGMPAAVGTWVDTHSFAAVGELHRDLLQTMRDDFAKYGHTAAPLRIEKVFAALPRLVGRKFQPVQVDRDERSLGIKDAFRMLCMARVATAVQRTAANGIPLGAEVDDRYQKVCLLDVGLLTTQVGLPAADLITGPQRRVDEGPIAEQFVGQELRACRPFNQEPALFTWVREARNSNADVDYVLQLGSRIVPIEVKAGAAGRLRSLHMMIHEKQLDLAVRIGSGPIQLRAATTALPHLPPRPFRLLSLPFYLIGEIGRLVRDL